MDLYSYFDQFEKLQRWINDDLKKSLVSAHANFLVALGLINYIEVLGSFYYPGHDNGKGSKRFNFVLNDLFIKDYMEELNKLNKYCKSPYDCLRCGMAHEYLIKTESEKNTTTEIVFTMYVVDNEHEYLQSILDYRTGLIVQEVQNKVHIKIINSRFIHDLNQAFEEYKERLLENSSEFSNKFIQRCSEIHIEKL